MAAAQALAPSDPFGVFPSERALMDS